MKKIKLSQQGKNKGRFFAIVDEEDFEYLNQWRWSYNARGYAVRGKDLLPLHRFLLQPPDNRMVDHINGNGLDNRKENLRICESKDNQRNQRKQQGTKSKYKGAYWHNQNKCWMAGITFESKFIFLGLFKTEHQAALCYDLWAADLFGKFARLNF